MAAVPPSWICVTPAWDHPRRAVGGLYRCAKYGWNRQCIVLKMCEFQWYAILTWKCLFASLLGCFGGKWSNWELLAVTFNPRLAMVMTQAQPPCGPGATGPPIFEPLGPPMVHLGPQLSRPCGIKIAETCTCL